MIKELFFVLQSPYEGGEWEILMIKAAHRVAIYLRVSTLDQTTANQGKGTSGGRVANGL
jgi:hypothetical protein